MSDPLPPAEPVAERKAAPIAPVLRKRGPGRIRLALLAIAWIFALGFLCAGIFAAVVQPGARPSIAVRTALWIASHLGEEPATRGALAALVLGLVQAAICFVALGLLALATTLRAIVASLAAMLAEALPSLIVLALQGMTALLPAPILLARIACVALGGIAGTLAVLAARRISRRRARGVDAGDAG